MKFFNIVYMLSACTLLAGLMLFMPYPEVAPYVYLPSAVVFAVMQYVCRPRSNNFVVRRLLAQQFLAGIAFILAGVLMITHKNNEWIMALSIGAFVEVYTIFRISSVIAKEENEG